MCIGLKAKYVRAIAHAQKLEIICRNRREKYLLSLNKSCGSLDLQQVILIVLSEMQQIRISTFPIGVNSQNHSLGFRCLNYLQLKQASKQLNVLSHRLSVILIQRSEASCVPALATWRGAEVNQGGEDS